jgi:hypothetical protein
VKTELSSSQYSEFVGLIKVYKTDKDINRFSVRIRELFEKPGLTMCLDGNHTNLYFRVKKWGEVYKFTNNNSYCSPFPCRTEVCAA